MATSVIVELALPRQRRSAAWWARYRSDQRWSFITRWPWFGPAASATLSLLIIVSYWQV